MSVYVQTNQPINMPNGAYTVSAEDTGKLILIPALTTATRVITLPPVEPGLHYRFMATPTAGLGQIARITTVNLLNGLLINNAGAGVLSCVAKNSANSADLTATAVTGDFIDAYCDGTRWNISGLSSVAAGLA